MKSLILKSSLGEWLTKKLSQEDIKRFCEENKTGPSEKVLIVHSDDMAYDYCFPNRVKANVDTQLEGVTVKAEKYYYRVHDDENKYDVIVCTGLLEHVPEPGKTIEELHRLLAPGGRLLVSVSSSFSTHNAPEDFCHFTVFGAQILFAKEKWGIISARPSSQPFRTLAILLQRTCYQTEMNRVLKLFFLLLARLVPNFDKFIKKDHGDINKSFPMESSLYSNVQIIAKKFELHE